MSNSNLVNYTRLSPNCSSRDGAKIDTITIHHMAGNLSVETCGRLFADGSREASSNYAVDSDGRVGMYVPEDTRSWCSSSYANDRKAITIEVANDEIGGDWHVSDKAMNKLIDLCADVCKRNGIKKLNYTGDTTGNLTMHCWFAATACPGPYLKRRFPNIAETVNKKLTEVEPSPKPTPKPTTLYKVQTGAFRIKANCDRQVADLKRKGFTPYVSLSNGIYRVQVGAFADKKNAENFLVKVRNAGFPSSYITEATSGSKPNTPVKPKKSVNEIAKEVIRGDWGNGLDRKKRLEDAGYNYNGVMTEVNRLLY